MKYISHTHVCVCEREREVYVCAQPAMTCGAQMG